MDVLNCLPQHNRLTKYKSDIWVWYNTLKSKLSSELRALVTGPWPRGGKTVTSLQLTRQVNFKK